jgi:hypothetical protein
VLARLVFRNLSGPTSFVITVSPVLLAIADGIGTRVYTTVTPAERAACKRLPAAGSADRVQPLNRGQKVKSRRRSAVVLGSRVTGMGEGSVGVAEPGEVRTTCGVCRSTETLQTPFASLAAYEEKN